MTANQIMLALLPLIVLFLVVWLLLYLRKLKRNEPPKVHGPHTQGVGYDAKVKVRSKGNGMADGGIG